MESKNSLKALERENALEKWLRGLGYGLDLSVMAGDASSRRYYRLSASGQTYIVMDAPPAEHDLRRFIWIDQKLARNDVLVPEILACDEQHGFLLLSDLGDHTFLEALTNENADQLYKLALDGLIAMQASAELNALKLPQFGQQWMLDEWQWHKDWFLGQLLDLDVVAEATSLDQCMQQIIQSASSQPQVFMHRDYHSANLMFYDKKVGVLDFQDAFIGPLTYDLASLLRDCYISWPKDRVQAWLKYYLENHQRRSTLLSGVELSSLERYFDLMGLQRHIKALMTFARKYVRDKQDGYLKHIPGTLDYITSVSQRYPEMQSLHQFYADKVKLGFDQVMRKIKKGRSSCEQ